MLWVVYTALLLIPTLCNLIGPERFWLGAVNMYLPQWAWGIPVLLLAPVTFFKARKLLWAPAFALFWVAVPLMGFQWRFPPKPTPGTLHIRIMTYNVKGGRRDAAAIAADITRYHPDILLMQDQQGVLQGIVGKLLKSWNVRYDYQFVIASHFPILNTEQMPGDTNPDMHCCLRATLMANGTPVTVYDVHLRSPREGLLSLKTGHTAHMLHNIAERLQESARLKNYLLHEHGPLLVAGDFNSTDWALALRNCFAAGLHDAFLQAGRGYGYTYGQYTPLHTPFMRIDHILTGRGWQANWLTTGNALGSDHRPVIADVSLKVHKKSAGKGRQTS